MSLGTSIFLSAILLSIIILFISTKDKWKWKKIIFWPVLVLVGLSILFGAGVYVYQYISNRPKPQTSFWDISLDSTKSDIKFLKGEPEKDSADDDWYYVKGETYLFRITFRDNKVRFIAYDGDNLHSPSLQGIDIGTKHDGIVNKFGQPSYVSISEDELMRILSYDRYNVFFVLKENAVCNYGIYTNTFGPVKFSKEKKPDLKK